MKPYQIGEPVRFNANTNIPTLYEGAMVTVTAIGPFPIGSEPPHDSAGTRQGSPMPTDYEVRDSKGKYWLVRKEAISSAKAKAEYIPAWCWNLFQIDVKEPKQIKR